MKTTILATAVLMALSITAHAEFTDVKAEVAATTSDEKNKKDQKTKADVLAKAKMEAEAQDKIEPQVKNNAELKQKKITGFQDQDGTIGNLEVGIVGEDAVLKFTPDSCKAGDCTKVVVFDKKTAEDMTDMKAIRDALAKAAKPSVDLDDQDEILTTAEKRRLERKKEAEVTTITENDVREEISLMLSNECGLDEDAVTSTRNSRDLRNHQNLDSALESTRFAGLDIPEKSRDSIPDDKYKSDAECSANVLTEFMEQYETEDLSDLKDNLAELKLAQKQWKLDLRRETSEALRARIEKKINASKVEIEKIQKELTETKKIAAAYDKATSSVARRLIINPAVSDLATRKFFTAEDFYLHDLAATTPDSFKGVRQAASNSLLDIYRRQAQTYLAFNEMANKTNDPVQKIHFSESALYYQQAGMNYHGMMSNNKFRRELSQNAEMSGLDSTTILNEIYGHYTPRAQEITSYLTSTNTTGINGSVKATTNQTLPPSLMVQNSDGTYSPATITNGQVVTTGGVNGRGERIGANGLQGNRTVIQLARPVPQAPNLNFNAQPGMLQQPQPLIIQQPQPLISQPRGRTRF